MDIQRQVMDYIFRDGFFPDRNPLVDEIPYSVFEGLNAWVRGLGLIISDSGTTIVGNSGGANPLMNVGGVPGGMTGGSGVVTEHANTTWFAGSGNAVKNGLVLGASAGRLYLISGGAPVEAGLDAPTGAPIIDAAGAASAKGLQGVYSLRLAPFRSATGALGNAGPASAPIATNKKKYRVTTWPAPVVGQTEWVLYWTKRGFGLRGPHFRFITITLAQAVANFEVDFYDNELTDLASFTRGKPPACTHCLGLGPFMLALGTDGGYGIRVSLGNEPEAYDIAHTIMLPVREAITGVATSSTGGVGYVSTRNSLSALIVTGSDLFPVVVRPYWGTTGFAHGNAWCVADEEIYGISAKRGPVRTQGGDTPDVSFARPVKNWMAKNGFTAQNTRVCTDSDNDAILYASGNKVLPFMRTEQVWSTPIQIPGGASAALGLNGQGLIGSGTNLYTLDSAGAGGPWFVQSHFRMGDPGVKHHRKTLRYWKGSGSAALTVDLLINKAPASVKTINQVAGHSPISKFRVPGAISVAVKVTGTQGGQEFHLGELTYLLDPSKR